VRGSADFFLSLSDLELALIDCVFDEIVRSAVHPGGFSLTARHGKASVSLTDVFYS
jgi:hypothetical protein